jgi:NDP-sugar pyrophosphorylase family protein
MSDGAAPSLQSIDVLVLAGGLGTRLRPAIGELPKLLAPVAGKPFLFHLLAWLGRFGARRVVLSLGYQAGAVLDYLSGQRFGDIDVVPVIEPEPLGTAGAIRFVRDRLNSDPVLVLNGDTYVDADLSALVAHQRRAGAAGTVLCVEVEDAGRYGRLTLDPAGRVIGFSEKDSGFHGRGSISGGIYALSAALLDQIAASPARSLEKDVFERLPPGALEALAGAFAFIDIGTPDSLATASSFVPMLHGGPG